MALERAQSTPRVPHLQDTKAEGPVHGPKHAGELQTMPLGVVEADQAQVSTSSFIFSTATHLGTRMCTFGTTRFDLAAIDGS